MTALRRKSEGWWIVAGKGDRPGKCLTCGAVLHLQLPQPIPIFVAAANAFVKIHLRCGPPRETAAQRQGKEP